MSHNSESQAINIHRTKQMVEQAREAQNRKNADVGIGQSKHARIRLVPTSLGEIRVLEYGFDSQESQPLMIDLHGGGFIFNSADVDERIILKMRETVKGCKFISIDYPKAPEAPFPAAPNAVYEVAQYYVNHAHEYGIDSSRMVIGGHSAGGNLATVTCMRAIQTKTFSFVGQILDYPPLNLAIPATQKANPKGSIPPELAMLFDTCYIADNDPKNPYISPVYAAENVLSAMPPALIIVCGMDSLGNEAEEYAHLLERSGVPVHLCIYPEALHGFTYDFTDMANGAIDKMAGFLKDRIEK